VDVNSKHSNTLSGRKAKVWDRVPLSQYGNLADISEPQVPPNEPKD